MKDTLEIISCPACGKEMKKVLIESANCNIDICVDGCGGIFFDNRELKKFDEQNENTDAITAQYKSKNYQKVNEHKQRICPVCESIMVKHYTDSKKEIEIDECYTCGAIFLDYNELDAIRAQYKTESERQAAFEKHFLKNNDISEFKGYKYKTLDDIYNNTEFTGANGRKTRNSLFYNKHNLKVAKFIASLF